MLSSKVRTSFTYAALCLLPLACGVPEEPDAHRRRDLALEDGSRPNVSPPFSPEETPPAAAQPDPSPPLPPEKSASSDVSALSPDDIPLTASAPIEKDQVIPESIPSPPPAPETPPLVALVPEFFAPEIAQPEVIVPTPPLILISPEPIPSPIAAETPIASPEPLTLAGALANLNEVRMGGPTFDSTKMGDAGKMFRLGDGYDVLNGLRTPSCLEPEGLDIQTQPLYETIDSFEVVRTNLDFYQKMQTEFGSEIGGAWKLFSASLSFKTKMLKETQIQNEDLLVMAGFSYLKEKVSLYKAWAEFAPYFKSAYEKSPFLFRRHCGDRYTQDVTMGAGLYLLVKAEKSDSTQYDKLEVETALKAGIANIITLGNTFANVTKEQREILKSYRFSTKCYSSGSSADVCAAYNLNTQLDPTTDAASMQKRVNEARTRIVDDVNRGEHLVVMQETLRDYEVPAESCTGSLENPCPDRWKAFYDYRPRSNKAATLLEERFAAEELCSNINYWPRRCAHVLKTMQTAILSCLSLNDGCNEPNKDELTRILQAKNPGKVQFWQDAPRRGRFFELDFLNRGLAPNQFFTIHSIGWGWLNDRTSSMHTMLAPGWKLRVYEHADENNAGQYRDLDSNRTYDNLGYDLDNFNDKLSAMRLMPPADLP